MADAVFDANTENLLRNLYRTDQWLEGAVDLGEGMPIVKMATAAEMPGRLLMSEEELAVFVTSFEHSGFTGGINWYRNFNRNWEILGAYEEKVHQPALMIHGEHDMVPASPTLQEHVPDVEVHQLDCGHWIQQERPEETNRLLLDWLSRLA